MGNVVFGSLAVEPLKAVRKKVRFPRIDRIYEKTSSFLRQKSHHVFYCTFTALLHKSLIMNGAGEGNRTLVTIVV
jgi:hypothetical protein